MINNIVFFNHYHNGDIFFSKGYVRAIMKLLPEINFFYAHSNDRKIIRDLEIGSYPMSNVPARNIDPFAEVSDTLYVNTWIGNHILLGVGGCNWLTLHQMYRLIFEVISSKVRPIELGSIRQYSPFIDYSFFDVPTDLELDFENTIMFSNSPVLSGQSSIDSVDFIVQALLDNFPEKKVILTGPTAIESDRIMHTSNLIQTNGSDLNEITWISERCKFIIGRQSGPFSFMQVEGNVDDSRKTIISFSNDPNVDWLHLLKNKSSYSILMDHDSEALVREIVDIVGSAG